MNQSSNHIDLIVIARDVNSVFSVAHDYVEWLETLAVSIGEALDGEKPRTGRAKTLAALAHHLGCEMSGYLEYSATDLTEKLDAITATE
ncbi:MAG: hypothetical protein WC997_08080 [Porticoccaceae bacterium]